jgi:hypothetical protein
MKGLCLTYPVQKMRRCDGGKNPTLREAALQTIIEHIKKLLSIEK